ncbi:MAG: hypothetical protein ACXVRN_12440, partial [Solirubrobacteraceae bacterium]
LGPQSAPLTVTVSAPDRARRVLVVAPAESGQRVNLHPVGAAKNAVGFPGTGTDASLAYTVPAGTQMTGAQTTRERLARDNGMRLPRPSVPLPDQAAFGGGNAASGGLGFYFFGAAALIALFVAVMPGMAWALVTPARPGAAQPFLSLLERPG